MNKEKRKVDELGRIAAKRLKHSCGYNMASFLEYLYMTIDYIYHFLQESPSHENKVTEIESNMV